ncbi:MAG: TetR/AcrR family transcriptional regulator [Acidimicrobiales bacterium]
MQRSRAPKGTISREQVVTTATEIVKAGGYEDMTIRSLAAELGVAPMSLYRHVRDKDDILDEVVDRVLARTWRPSGSQADWKEWIIQAADKLRRLLVRQPAALHVYLRHPVVSPSAIARMDAMMTVLREALTDEETARRAYASIHTYTVGFAALESSRAGWAPPVDEPDALAVQLAAYTTPKQFVDGLRLLILGIQQGSLPTEPAAERC